MHPNMEDDTVDTMLSSLQANYTILERYEDVWLTKDRCRTLSIIWDIEMFYARLIDRIAKSDFLGMVLIFREIHDKYNIQDMVNVITVPDIHKSSWSYNIEDDRNEFIQNYDRFLQLCVKHLD